jgi:hypothetical protein
MSNDKFNVKCFMFIFVEMYFIKITITLNMANLRFIFVSKSYFIRQRTELVLFII